VRVRPRLCYLSFALLDACFVRHRVSFDIEPWRGAARLPIHLMPREEERSWRRPRANQLWPSLATCRVCLNEVLFTTCAPCHINMDSTAPLSPPPASDKTQILASWPALMRVRCTGWTKRRVERYLKAGADGLFVEAPDSIDEMTVIARSFDVPQLVNPLEGGRSPILSPTEYGELGFRMIGYGITLLLQAAEAMQIARPAGWDIQGWAGCPTRRSSHVRFAG
jgi:Phosphoenolpyruvate phosphomutase